MSCSCHTNELINCVQCSYKFETLKLELNPSEMYGKSCRAFALIFSLPFVSIVRLILFARDFPFALFLFLRLFLDAFDCELARALHLVRSFGVFALQSNCDLLYFWNDSKNTNNTEHRVFMRRLQRWWCSLWYAVSPVGFPHELTPAWNGECEIDSFFSSSSHLILILFRKIRLAPLTMRTCNSHICKANSRVHNKSATAQRRPNTFPDSSFLQQIVFYNSIHSRERIVQRND